VSSLILLFGNMPSSYPSSVEPLYGTHDSHLSYLNLIITYVR
jgi:hypothetical protein